MGTVVAIVLTAAALLAPVAADAFGPLSSFGGDGEGAGQLSAPGGIAVGPGGNFFVADNGNDRVAVFAPGGEFLYAFGKGVRPGGGGVCDALSGCRRGDGGDAAGALERPEGIAVSAAGDVYVTEEGNGRVSVFTTDGAFRFAFGSEVDPAGGNVCTAGSGCRAGSNDQPLDPEGNPVEDFPGPAAALLEPRGVAIDADGDVFVADSGNSRISAYDSAGRFLYTFGIEVEGKPGFASFCAAGCIEGFAYDGAGGMSEPTGIAALPGELLVISDTGNHRLDFFAEKGEFLRAIGNEVDWSGADACTTERENEISEGVFELGCRAGRGNGAGSLGEPAGLAVSPTGAITVTDFALHRVSRFDPSGGFLRAFGAGVASGAEAFEVCTALTGCLPGSGETALAGATPHPLGVAEACGGSLFVAESASGLSRVERFGEPGSLRAFCPPPEEPVLPQDPGPTDPGLPPAPPADSAPPALIAPPAAASNAIALGAARRDRRRGTATLAITVPAAGQLTLAGRGVRTVARTLTAAATVAMPVRLFGKARRGLLASGHRRVTATITFVPSGGSARTETRKLTLVKMPPPRRR